MNGRNGSATGTSLLWFRNDLRLRDNPALQGALASTRMVVPVFIHEPARDHRWNPGPATLWWLRHSLRELDGSLRRRGSRLLIRIGPAPQALVALARESGARAVCWNRHYEPTAAADEAMLTEQLGRAGVQCHSFNGGLLHEPDSLLNRQGSPYRVFGAFWKRARLEPEPGTLAEAPERLPSPPRGLKGLTLDELPLPTDAIPAASGWEPGETGADRRLREFLHHGLAGYTLERELPGHPGTSRLSPHLHFGEISPLRVRTEIRRQGVRRGGPREAAEAFERQLYWREFAHYLLHHFPHTADHPLDERFERFSWSADARLLDAWKRGMTGYPMVDAAMRELLATGWMHNRARMIAASLLTKNLRIHWLEGARWFWRKLVDADLANNTLGWQWTAGCGADAAPFFRVFNPARQGERHDPEGEYVRRWVPELSNLPNRWIHNPAQAPGRIIADAGITLGPDYPLPVVRFASSRERALLAYRKLPRRSR